MSGPGRRFDPAELRPEAGSGPSEAELAAATAMARDLEAVTARDVVTPTAGFDDRVMAAIATEPPARLVIRPGSSLRGGFLAGLVLTAGDAWRLATGPGRPVAIRAQALAFLLVAVLALGSVTAAVGVGAAAFLRPDPGPTPAPVVSPSPSVAPSATPTPSASESTAPSASASDATETAEPTDDHHETAKPTPTDDHRQTPRPTRTPRATETPEPTETNEPESSDDHGGGHGGPGPG